MSDDAVFSVWPVGTFLPVGFFALLRGAERNLLAGLHVCRSPANLSGLMMKRRTGDLARVAVTFLKMAAAVARFGFFTAGFSCHHLI